MRSTSSDKGLYALGAIQLGTGLVCVVLQSLADYFDVPQTIYIGVWCGVFFGVSGLSGLVAGRYQSTGWVATFLALSILSTLLTLPLLGVSADFTQRASVEAQGSNYAMKPHAFWATLLAMSLLEGVVAFATSIKGCKFMCNDSPIPKIEDGIEMNLQGFLNPDIQPSSQHFVPGHGTHPSQAVADPSRHVLVTNTPGSVSVIPPGPQQVPRATPSAPHEHPVAPPSYPSATHGAAQQYILDPVQLQQLKDLGVLKKISQQQGTHTYHGVSPSSAASSIYSSVYDHAGKRHDYLTIPDVKYEDHIDNTDPGYHVVSSIQGINQGVRTGQK